MFYGSLGTKLQGLRRPATTASSPRSNGISVQQRTIPSTGRGPQLGNRLAYGANRTLIFTLLHHLMDRNVKPRA